MSKKKIVLIIVVCLMILAIISGIYIYQRPVQVVSFSQAAITRACITNGNNGRITELTENDLNLIYNDLKDVPVKRVEDVKSVGWSYYIDFFKGDKVERVVIISSKEWEVSGKRYEVSEEAGKKIMSDIEKIEE